MHQRDIRMGHMLVPTTLKAIASSGTENGASASPRPHHRCRNRSCRERDAALLLVLVIGVYFTPHRSHHAKAPPPVIEVPIAAPILNLPKDADSQTAPAPVEITPQPNETNELTNDSAPKEITHPVTADDVRPARFAGIGLPRSTGGFGRSP